MNSFMCQRSIGTATDKRLVAAGPLMKTRATVPLRYVIVYYADSAKFGVHRELFRTEDMPKMSVDAAAEGNFRSSLDSSDYILIRNCHNSVAHALSRAVEHFTERMKREVEHSLTLDGTNFGQ